MYNNILFIYYFLQVFYLYSDCIDCVLGLKEISI